MPAAGSASSPGWGPRLALAWAAVLLLLAPWGGGVEACPSPCSCLGSTVDCHGRGIYAVPKNIPRGTERL